ncbi:hypothetical protein HYH02_003170 [Chlamydomonas schloesseri]|uniref:Right handed beta helix domain-containing protein n=1 Tax=Chlamydomonas schloesseri TaxID=2026947 RepID=A0A836BA44_9CHLO|nr:hypothetical protein HYH02_003170 [Chlamydomonas schloesseri]|eukprot:KAG2452138.1 hypothetical protein HYH02_003170 [Chlamydomonas schloesseri]
MLLQPGQPAMLWAGSKGAPLPVITDDELLNGEASVISSPSTPHIDELDSPVSAVRGGGHPGGGRPWSFIEQHNSLTPAGKGPLIASLSFGSTVGAHVAAGAGASGRAKRGSSTSGGGADNGSSAGSSHGGAAGGGDRSGASSSQGTYPPLPPLDAARPTSSEQQLRLQPFSSAAAALPDDAPLMALGTAGGAEAGAGPAAERGSGGSRRGGSGPQGFVASANAVAAAAAASLTQDRLLAPGTGAPLLPSSSLATSASGSAASPGAAGVARSAPRKARTSGGSPAITPLQLAPLPAVPEAGGGGAVAVSGERRGRSFGRSLSVNAGSLGDGTGSSSVGAGAETAPGGTALSARASTPPVLPVTQSLGGGAGGSSSSSSGAVAGVSARLKTTSLNQIRLGQQQQQSSRQALLSSPTRGASAVAAAVAPHPAWITPGGLSPPQRDMAAVAPSGGGGRLSQPPSPPQPGGAAASLLPTGAGSTQPRFQASPTGQLQGRGSGVVPGAASGSSGSTVAGGRHAATSAPLPRLPELALYSPPGAAAAAASNTAAGGFSSTAAAFLAGTPRGVARSPALPASPAMEPGNEADAEASEVIFGHGGGAAAATQLLGEGEVPALPEVVVRVPRWLKPSAFQITEKPRSGRLQELVDMMAAVAAPTIFDLGGLEFSGAVVPPPPPQGPQLPGHAHSSTSFYTATGADSEASSPQPQRSRATFINPDGVGSVSINGRGSGTSNGSRYRRHSGPIAPGRDQVIAIPPGQYITLYNATLLLTAEQYILVGAGASLTLKSVEVMGCSRDAAVASAAVRRRALSSAAAAAVASSSLAQPSVQPSSLSLLSGIGGGAAGGGSGGSSAAVTAPGSVAGSGFGVARQLRRTSSPGRGDVYVGLAAAAATTAASSHRASASGGAGDGLPALAGGGTGGAGRRRAVTNSGAASTAISAAPSSMNIGSGSAALGPFVLSIPPPIVIPNSSGIHELVDANEYVDEHGLIEIQGGHMRISNSRIWPGRVQLALCVSAGGGATVQYGTTGAVCAAGPRSVLAMEQSNVEGGAAGCVSALHGARVGLSGCRLRGGAGATSAGEGGAGAGSSSGGSAATGTCEVGLEARGGGTLATASECELAGCGAAAADGAALHMSGCRVSYASAYGVLARDPGTTLYGRGLRIDDARRSGVAAADGAEVRLVDSTVAGSAGGPGVVLLPPTPTSPQRRYGGSAGDVVVVGSSSLLLHEREALLLHDVEGAPMAAPAPAVPRAVVSLLRCAVSANAGHGMVVGGGGLGQVYDSELYNNMYCGLEVGGRGSWLEAVGARLIRNEAQGIKLVGGAGGALTRVTCTGNGRDGVALEGGGTAARLAKCEARENRESGVCITGGAAATMSGCRLSANQHDGLSVGGLGSLALAEGCAFLGNTAKGAVVCMGGAAELGPGCSLHGNGSRSVQVMDEGSRLVLARGVSTDRTPVAANGGKMARM